MCRVFKIGADAFIHMYTYTIMCVCFGKHDGVCTSLCDMLYQCLYTTQTRQLFRGIAHRLFVLCSWLDISTHQVILLECRLRVLVGVRSRWNTREDIKIKHSTTQHPGVRERLWARLLDLVPQNEIPAELNASPPQAREQECQRKGSSGPTPNSAAKRVMPGGLFGMFPATFYLDFFGNVVSPSAVSGTLTWASVDHIFPYSRGGLSKLPMKKGEKPAANPGPDSEGTDSDTMQPEREKVPKQISNSPYNVACDSNLMLLQHVSNHRKGNLFQQDFVR